ncbi:MAG: PAS domain S-box protein [Candidatus Aureabacteria bacterium]|nr:PAS domain S-box protein [Candidatus Auribacterota bacterium]
MKPPGKSKLSRRIFVYFFIVSALPLLFMAIASYHVFSRSLEEHIRNKLIAISDGRQAALKQTIYGISRFITERASGPTPVTGFEKFTAAFASSGIQSEEHKALDSHYREAFQRYFDVNDYIYDMLFVSNEGNVIFSMKHESDFGQNINSPLLKTTALFGLVNTVNTVLSTSFSDFDFYPPSHQAALFAATPAFGEGKLLGVMVLQIKPEIFYAFAQNYVGLPKSGEITFAKRVGDEVVYTTPLRFKPDAALNYKIKIGSHIAVPMQKAVSGETGIGFSTDYRGKSVLARWQYIPQLHWGMIVKVDTDEVFRSIHQLRNLYIILFCILIGLILMASFVVARTICGPIETVRDGLKIIGGGNLGHRINIARNDEIGELAEDVGAMAENLQHTTASIDKLNKEITQRKKVEEALQESERTVRAILDQTFQFIGLMTVDGVLIDANKAALKFAGIEESQVLNKPFWETPWWTHSAELQNKLRDAVKKVARGEFIRFEATHMLKGGGLHYVDFSLKPVKDDAGTVIFMIPEGRDITDRKKVEERLRSSEAWLSVTLKSIGDAVIATDTKGRITFVNPVASRLTGWSQEEATGMPLKEVFHIVNEETGAPVENPATRVLKEGVVVGLGNHTILLAKNGTRCPIDDSAAPIMDDGQIIGVVLIFRDITERRRAEEKIARANREWANTFDSISDFVFILNNDSTIAKVNRSFLDVLHLEEKDVVGKKCYEIVHKTTTPWPECPHQKTLLNRKPQTEEVDDPGVGLPLQVSVSPIFDEQGELLGSVHIARDISSTRKADAALRESEEKYRSLVENMMDVIYAMDAEGKVTAINQAVKTNYGYEPEEVLGRNFLEFHKKEVYAPVVENFHHILKGEKVLGEAIIIDKQGLEHNVEFSGVPIVRDGIVAGVRGMMRDVTERKKILEQKNNFMNMVSHELRTPLTSIKEGISLVAEGIAGPINPQQKELLDIGKQNIDRLSRLINQVLDFQAIDSGSMQFSFRENDINRAVKEARASLLSLATKKGIQLNLALDESLPLIKFDKDKILGVLINLLNNALKFTEKGSITITTERGDNIIKVSIKDTGIGIKEEDMPKLFQRFSQVKRKAGGSGLGLAISKEIIEAHNGKIGAKSEFGKGTTLHFILPIKERRLHYEENNPDS